MKGIYGNNLLQVSSTTFLPNIIKTDQHLT